MKNTISLGNIELLLSVNGGKLPQGGESGCTYRTSFWGKYLKDLLKYYGMGLNFRTANNGDVDAEAFIRKMEDSFLPALTDWNESTDFNEAIAPLVKVMPSIKMGLEKIKDPGDVPNPDPALLAIPIYPLIYGLAFLLGIYDGMRNDK